MNRTSKQDMIEHCRHYYRHNTTQLKYIDEFEQTYQCTHAIYWYSRSSFVSHLVNQALRTEDINLLYTFRFFIVDLSTNIRSLAAAQSSVHNEILHLQRGLTLTNVEIAELQSNTGNLTSPNGFMSTSRCTKIANIYGTNAIFEIEVDTRLNICADIVEQSACHDEREIGFDLGSVFRIQDVRYNKDNNHILQINDTNRPEMFFGELIYLMKQYDKAKRYFHHLKQEYLKQEQHIFINQEEFLKLKLEYNQQARQITDKQLILSTSTLVMIAELYQMRGNGIKAIQH